MLEARGHGARLVTAIILYGREGMVRLRRRFEAVELNDSMLSRGSGNLLTAPR